MYRLVIVGCGQLHYLWAESLEISSGTSGRFDAEIGQYYDNKISIRILPHLNSPAEVEPFKTVVVRYQSNQIDLSQSFRIATGMQ